MTKALADVRAPALAAFDDDERAMLREAVAAIRGACAPKRIWLFGSRARGDAHPGSDWDLLVIVADGQARAARRDVDAALHWLEGRLEGRLEAHVWESTGFCERLHLRASFPSTVAREGIILDEEVAMGAVDAGEWLRRAGKDRRSMDAVMALEPPEVSDALSHAQQLCEKVAKAMMALHDVTFPHVHELDRLARPLRALEPDIAARLERHAPWGALGLALRYPFVGRSPVPLEEPEAADAHPALEDARALLRAALARMRDVAPEHAPDMPA